LGDAERKGEPPGLIGEDAVVHAHVEHDADREHQRHELDRPPALDRERNEECRRRGDETRLDAADQRVRHTRLANACAAYFAPAIVSAGGNAHWPATPASESVCVNAGTVESGARTIQRSCVSRSCASTRSASSGSCW